MLKNSSVLITGATGSLGQELVRRLLAMPEGPSRIIIFSRDELKQHDMAKALGYKGQVDGERLRFFIGDVRDQGRLEHAFRGVDYVIHAAALKHVPACEYNPTEAISINIDGAICVVNAAITAGVKRVLALSTDKAVNPANLYGATKACAEKLFVAANAMAGALPTRFSCVRYGNVLGSRGSVLQLWRSQIAAGKKITMTDARMTRFWITLPHAAQFVLERLADMRGAEVFVPKIPSTDMATLAEALGQASHESIPVRQGEKYHETLIGPDEAHTAWEAHDYYSLQATAPVDTRLRRVENGWTYNSRTNKIRLTKTELELLLQEIP